MTEDVKLPIGQTLALADRKITADTCKKFGVTVLQKNGVAKKHAYPFMDIEGEHIATKLRSLNKKDFKCIGPIGKAALFGQQAFDQGGKYITVTEGELDAMATYQMMGSKYPVVSLKNGSNAALKECKQNYDFLNSYDNVIFCFDNDVAGKKAAKEVLKLFPLKAKTVQLTAHNDPCDYLKVNGAEPFVREWWNAKGYAVDGFTTGIDVIEIIKRKVGRGVALVWDKLTRTTYGLRKKEVWFLAGGTGLGKSEVFKEIMYDLAVNQDIKVGGVFLEEDEETTWKSLLGKDMGKRLNLEENAQLVEDYSLDSSPNAEKLLKNIVVLKHDGNSDFDYIISRLEYMAVALDCEYLFFDHFTACAEGKKDSGNSNVHYMMEKLNQLVHSKDVGLLAISHLRKTSGSTPAEEGGHVSLDDIYGSAAIKQRSNFVFVLEGNINAQGMEKNIRTLRCLKDRNTGQATGMDNAVVLQYDGDTGRLEEMEMEE